MSVWNTQLDAEVQVGDYVILPLIAKPGGGHTTKANGTLISGRDLLSVKAQSHTDYGWTVVWFGPDRFTATKIYLDGLIRKRTFEIR